MISYFTLRGEQTIVMTQAEASSCICKVRQHVLVTPLFDCGWTLLAVALIHWLHQPSVRHKPGFEQIVL